MLEQDFIIAHLTTWGEARSETQASWAAIAWTFNNRLALPLRYGTSIAQVCLRPAQYSSWSPGKPGTDSWANWEAMLTADGPEFTALCQVVDTALEKLIPDPTEGSTHYWDSSIPQPYWAHKATWTVKIDKFQFVKDVP